MNREKHIVVSRLWFDDTDLMDKYLSVAKEVLVPALKRQKCRDFHFGIIVHQQHVPHVKKALGIDFTAFDGMEAYKKSVSENKYTIQTRHDIDDWMSANYIARIQEEYERHRKEHKSIVIHAYPVKVTYPGWQESEMREYSSSYTSMFLSLCQEVPQYSVFERQHGSMHVLATKVIKLEKGYAKWVQHNNSVSNTRDKVRGKMVLSGPDNVLHTWVQKPPAPTDRVDVRYINGKIKDHPRRYAEGIVKQGIGQIIERQQKRVENPAKIVVPVRRKRAITEYDKDYKIGVVIVCYETPELIKKAVNSVSGVKDLRVMIIDNSSPGSECYKVCDNLAVGKNIDVIHTGENIFHGPGLHKGIESLSTEYICVMDSDAEVVDAGVFEKMVDILQDKSIYAVGAQVEYVPGGSVVKTNAYKGHEFDYVKPWFAMLKLNEYYRHHPFIHHGAPWCQTMIDIKGVRKVVLLEDAKKYVKHLAQGTYSVAEGKWLKGWQAPIIRKYLNVLMICFVYNEINYLHHVIDFWKNQGVDVYVIDNMSDDGTWDWLQKNDISSHQFDTKGMFHLAWLQEELTRTLHKIKPHWVIYGAADLYYGFDEPIKNVIQKAHDKGYSQIRTDCWFAVNTGEERKLPLLENYFYCKPFTRITMISKYDSTINFAGDHIHLENKKVLDVEGLILNYGSCKLPEEQDIKLRRRQKAWDAGLTKTYGSHYREGKDMGWVHPVEKRKDIRESPYFKYYQNILSICSNGKASQAHVSHAMRNFKDAFLTKYGLMQYHNPQKPAIIYGMYDGTDYSMLTDHVGPLTIVWCGTDAAKINDGRAAKLNARKDSKNIATSRSIASHLDKYKIKYTLLPVTPAVVDLNPCKRGDHIYMYYGAETTKAFYGYDMAKEVERRTGVKVIYATHKTFTRKELLKVYEDCFVGLRLTPRDGVSVTAVELGMMGRRVIFNGDCPNSIKWKGIDDICGSVLKEYSNRHIDDTRQVSQSVKNYLNIGNQWMEA